MITLRIQRIELVAWSLAFLFVAYANNPVSGQELTVAITRNEAAADYPSGINFVLESTANSRVERVELLFRAADSKTLNLATPTFVAGTSINVNYPLDLETHYLPPGVDVVYRWRLIMADGSTKETEPATVLWFDDRFTWERFDSEQVTVYAYNGDTALSQRILDSAQRTVTKLEADLGVPVSSALRIWVYESSADLAGAQPPNSNLIAGVTYAWLDLIAVAIASGNDSEIGRIIPHEVSHHVFYQATLNPFNHAPYWLDEGLAIYYQEAGQNELAAVLESAIAEGRITSVRALNSPFAFEQEAFRTSYAQSWSIVGFIVAEFGQEKLGALVRVYRDGVSHADAVQLALGVSLEELDAQWKASIEYVDYGGFTVLDSTSFHAGGERYRSAYWRRLELVSRGLEA